MKSAVTETMPTKLRRSLVQFGSDLSLARKRRHLTVRMMAERLGISKTTYLRAEKGDPTVSMGVYAMALFVLGFGDRLRDLIDARRDEQGLMLDAERLPKRIRMKRAVKPL
jgi:transcriptional regulator with XRE-family HTH domain